MEKHKKRQTIKNKKKRNLIIIIIAILIIIASIIFYILRSNMTDLQEITHYEYDNSIINEIIPEEPIVNELDLGIEMVDVSDMPAKANGYNVMGQIVLDKIGIKCYIFDTSSRAEREAALKFGTVRFKGPDLNEPR